MPGAPIRWIQILCPLACRQELPGDRTYATLPGSRSFRRNNAQMTKNGSTHQRALSLTLLVAGFLLTSGLVSVGARLPDPAALVRITAHDDRDLALLDASGVPVFARLPGRGGPSFLAGATPAQVTELQNAGLSVDVVDPDFQGEGTYLAYRLPGRPSPQWASYGRLLFIDNGFALLSSTSLEATRLAQTGIEVRALTLDPKPVHQAAVRSAFSASIDPDPMVQSMIDAVSSTTVRSSRLCRASTALIWWSWR